MTSVDPRHITASLAYDVASQLLSMADILEKYGLTKEQMEAIVRSDEFRSLYREAKLLWDNDIDSRLELKAKMSLEDNLLSLHRIAHDPTLDPSDRVAAVKLLATVAGKGGTSRNPDGGGGQRVLVNINIPQADPTAAPQVVSVEADVLPEPDPDTP